MAKFLMISEYQDPPSRPSYICNATIRMDPFVKVSLRMRSLTQRNSSLSCVGFDSLQCAYIRYSALNIASNRPRSETLRWLCKLAWSRDAILQLVAKPYARLRTITNALRRLAIDERSETHGCENLCSPPLFETFWQVRLILTDADAGKRIHAITTNALQRIETQTNKLKRM